MRHIVSYDISSDRDRRKMAKYLIENGLQRIQFSVFVGFFNCEKKEFIIEGSRKFFNHKVDSLVFIPLCQEDFDKHRSAGYGRELFNQEENFGKVMLL